MERYDEIMGIFSGADDATISLVKPLVNDMVFLENQLDNLKKLPFIKIHPDLPELQKSTPAAKQYKELLQQYTNIIKIISHINGDESESDISPLREWIKSRGV